MDKFTLPKRFSRAELSVWNEFASLNLNYTSVDLGQGKPNFMPFVNVCKELENIVNVADHSFQQRGPEKGQIRLRQVISQLYGLSYKRELDADKEILITCGAYEALFDAIVGFIDEGDEIIIMEPFFDCYEPMSLVAGGVPRFIPLRKTGNNGSSADWILDENELRKLFNQKTKMVVVNSPMNPIGKVFCEKELTLIAELCVKYDVICLSDDVYEWLTYKPARPIKMASLPGMWERTITVCSSGKTLWMTGWKCGWAIGPEYLINRLNIVHEQNTLHYVTPIQEAVAECLQKELENLNSPTSWLTESNRIAHRKRDFFVKLLRDTGFDPIVPEGGFFIVADWSAIGKNLDLSSENSPWKDFRFCKWMLKNIGVTSIPTTAFYTEDHKYIGENWIRFCFIKTDETLMEAAECFKKIQNESLKGRTYSYR